MQAVWHHHSCGPNFGGGALRIFKDPMNQEGAGGSFVTVGNDSAYAYLIPTDAEGNSVLSGEGKSTYSCFTVAEIEVYRVRYAKNT